MLINRIDVTEQAIYHGKNSQFRTLLSRDIIKAERHLADLCELNEGGWSRHIPEIDRQSLFEMCRLRKPKDEIYQTMKAVYLLLGVDSTELTVFIIVIPPYKFAHRPSNIFSKIRGISPVLFSQF